MRKLILAGLICLLSTASLAESSGSVIGYWRTIDDATGKPKAVIRISENQDHSLSGQILKIYPRPGYDQNELCEHCTGDKHNQRIVGMTVMDNLKPDPENGSRYVKGSILDPHNGKIYHCNVLLTEDGKQLQVRGYLGIPLFGRSQTWIKINEA